MEKVVFIAHSYHKKTHSCDFIIDYLKEFFEVEIFFDEEWETGNKVDWKLFNDKYYAVIIWQMFPKREDFESIPNKNIIYFPMYDQVEKWQFSQWYLCKNIKIVSFSSTLYKKLKKWGFNSIYIQYFIEPKEFSPGNPDEVFFWQRLTKININTISKILKNPDVKIHLHKAVDPGQTYVEPTKPIEKKFKITYSEWFDSKEEMQEFIKTKGIYVSPRFSEGIGMSFLEAMAQGKVVLAHNNPTMNEYIQSGVTGFLCNFKLPRAIKLKNIEQIQKNTYKYMQKGYEKWLTDRKNIIDYINKPQENTELKLWVKLFKPLLLIERKDFISFKSGSNPKLILLGRKIF